MATHSSILAWKIPWTEGPGGLQSMWPQWVRHNWAQHQFQKAVPEGEGYEVVRKGHVLSIWRFLIWDIRDEQLPTIYRSKRHAEKILHDFSMEEREKKPICENIHSSRTQSSVLIQEAQQLSRLINFLKIHIYTQYCKPTKYQSKNSIFIGRKKRRLQ